LASPPKEIVEDEEEEELPDPPKYLKS